MRRERELLKGREREGGRGEVEAIEVTAVLTSLIVALLKTKGRRSQVLRIAKALGMVKERLGKIAPGKQSDDKEGKASRRALASQCRQWLL